MKWLTVIPGIFHLFYLGQWLKKINSLRTSSLSRIRSKAAAKNERQEKYKNRTSSGNQAMGCRSIRDGCRLEKLEIIDFSLVSVIFGLRSAFLLLGIRQKLLIPSLRKVCQVLCFLKKKNALQSHHHHCTVYIFLTENLFLSHNNFFRLFSFVYCFAFRSKCIMLFF